jgi:chemotaxis protein MotB
VTKASSGLIETKNQDTGRSSGGAVSSSSGSPMEMSMLRRLHTDLTRSMEDVEREDPGREVIQFKLSQEGLRITIFDRARRPIFQPDSAELTEYGNWILSTLAWELSRYKSFIVEVEGHTEAGRKAVSETYGNWELSADRANAGRRTLLQHGVNSDQIRKVAGFADTIPMEGLDPEDPSNRRITLFLRVSQGPRQQQL